MARQKAREKWEEDYVAELEHSARFRSRVSTHKGNGNEHIRFSNGSRFGIEARHLRPFKAAADREIGLVEQVVTPLVRQRNPEARARAEEVARELAALSVKLHSTLVRAGLGPGLRR